MTILTSEGWLLDIAQDYGTDNIILLVKLQSGKIIRFKQRLQEPIFYILPKSSHAGQILFQQLSRNDQLIKRVFWDEKYIDIQDKNKTSLIGIGLDSYGRQDYKTLI